VRAIIRFSIDNEPNGALRNKLLGKLRTAGFRLQAQTATYEHVNIDDPGLSKVLSNFWNTADLHHNQQGHPGRVDHFWMYCDRKRPMVIIRTKPKISN
jgi:hypothetical protein